MGPYATFTRYLAAKQSVDDRALNRHVWQSLTRALPPVSAVAPLNVLEVGAGVGTMIERLIDWKLLSAAAITAIDEQPANTAEAPRRLRRFAEQRDLTATSQGDTHLQLRDAERQIDVALEAIDLFAFIQREQGRRAWDLLIAHAFLDLMNVPETLPLLRTLVQPGGLLYLTITFDGDTILEPTIDRSLDEKIEALYHRTMDDRITAGKPSGDSRAGRHLFGHLRAAGIEIIDAGSSDWVVFAGAAGYPADEAYFLHFIIDTMRGALAGHPELDSERFAAWIAERHAQIERGELVYIAHQLDFLGRVPR